MIYPAFLFQDEIILSMHRKCRVAKDEEYLKKIILKHAQEVQGCEG